jgi:large subunit ribosomal protein L4
VQLDVVKLDGAADRQVEISDAVLGVEFKEPLVHQVVNAYQAGARAGTSAQKNRSAVRGGGSKPFRQKGTGRARAGTIRSPIWRGGGKIFPAETRSYSQKVNKKMYRLALRSILSELTRQGRLRVCDEALVSEPRTRALVSSLKSLGASDVLIVTDAYDENLALAARNLVGVEVCELNALNPVSLIRHETVLFTSGGLKRVEEMLQ